MCLILFAYHYHPKYHLILAANRDEFYGRPAMPLGYWKDAPTVLAGRDLKNMGTWMGINTTGSFAAITNYRDPLSPKPDAPSRGTLVGRFILEKHNPENYLADIEKSGDLYNGFNLLAGNPSELFYYSNKRPGITKIDSGIYGLSNDFLDIPWPKVFKGKAALKRLIEDEEAVDPEALLAMLNDRSYAPEKALPDTGVGDAWERVLSPLFITSEIYGTRCSSVLLIEKTGTVRFYERTFEKIGEDAVEGETVVYEFNL